MKQKLVIVIIALVVIGVLSVGFIQRQSSPQTARFDYQTWKLDIVDTPSERQQGLSGRKDLPAGNAMLFVFDEADKHCFWMKDMNFSIDMIWLNVDKKVVHIEPDVSPDSYPDQFCPDESARYVLEVRANQTKQLGITEGDSISF